MRVDPGAGSLFFRAASGRRGALSAITFTSPTTSVMKMAEGPVPASTSLNPANPDRIGSAPWLDSSADPDTTRVSGETYFSGITRP